MKNLADIYKIYKRISARTYLIRLEFSNLTPPQRVIDGFLGFYFLVVPIFYLCLLFIDSKPNPIFDLSFMFFCLFLIPAMKLKEKYRRIAFKEFYQSYKEEIEFSPNKNNFFRYFLLKKELLNKGIYNKDFIVSSLEELEIESKDPKPEPIFKNTLILIVITAAMALFWHVFDMVKSDIIRMSMLIYPAVGLVLIFYILVIKILDENGHKKKLLELEQHLERMRLDLKRKDIALVKSSEATRNSKRFSYS